MLILKRSSWGALALVFLFFMLECFVNPLKAQYGQGFESAELASTARRAADAMRQWHKKHGSFPSLDQDINKALKFVFEKTSGSSLNPNTQITYAGSVHVLENLRMSVDASIKNAPIEEWKRTPPASWNAPANSTVILTDGDDQFLIWSSIQSGGPMLDSNNRCLFIYQNLAPAPSEESDEQANGS